MNEALFNELIEAGVSKETAHAVTLSLNPEHLATKADILRLEKLIYDMQKKSDERFTELQMEMTKELAAIQVSTADKLAASNRQFLVTFLGLGLTACVLFTLNLYFH